MLFLVALSAPNVPDTGLRPATAEVATRESVADLQVCITRAWEQKGVVFPLPHTGGVTLDLQQRSYTIGGPGRALLSLSIEDSGAARVISIAYRHPMSEKGAAHWLNWAAERCAPEAREASRRDGETLIPSNN